MNGIIPITTTNPELLQLRRPIRTARPCKAIKKIPSDVMMVEMPMIIYVAHLWLSHERVNEL